MAPPVAAASEITKPLNPQAPFRTESSRTRFWLAGDPSTELYAVITESSGHQSAPERRKVQLFEEPGAQVDRIAVPASLTHVGDEVLGRGDDPRALERRHECGGHSRGQEGILAISLFHPAPAHVGGEVDHRAQHLPDPPAPGFPGRG